MEILREHTTTSQGTQDTQSELDLPSEPNEKAQALQVGVISDTHGAAIPWGVNKLFKACDLIIHAGDIGQQSTLDELELIAPVRAVLGNNDSHKHLLDSFGRVGDTASFKLGEIQVYLTHQPGHLSSMFKIDSLEPKEKALLIHGHTHVPKNEKHSSYTVLNPGAVYRPRGGFSPSVALVTIEDDQLSVKIHQL